MKNHQLLLFVLLFTSNGLIITQNSENIHPASFRNIEKAAIEKFNPSLCLPLSNKTHSNPASIKNYGLRTEKELCTSCKERKKIKIRAQRDTQAVLFMTNLWVSTLGGGTAVGFYSSGRKMIEENPPARSILGITLCSLSLGYIYHQLSDIQAKCHDIFNKKDGTIGETTVACLSRLLGLTVGIVSQIGLLL